MARRMKKRSEALAEQSEETPLWMLLQQASEQREVKDSEDLSGLKTPVNEFEKESKILKRTPAVSDADKKTMANAANEIVVDIEAADGHSLTCFMGMMYSYCDIINKAMQQEFHISDELMLHLAEWSGIHRAEVREYSAQDFRQTLSARLVIEPDGLRGIRFEDSRIIFEAFSDVEEGVKDSYYKFLRAMEDGSHSCRLSLSHSVHESEKFDMYQLFLKIHAGGKENRMMRKRMTERLTGYAAFPDEKTRARWQEKHGNRHCGSKKHKK